MLGLKLNHVSKRGHCSAQSHYLYHCWFIVRITWNKLQWHWNQNINYFHTRKWIWKFHLQDGMHFISMCWSNCSTVQTLEKGKHYVAVCRHKIWTPPKLWQMRKAILSHLIKGLQDPGIQAVTCVGMLAERRLTLERWMLKTWQFYFAEFTGMATDHTHFKLYFQGLY